MTTKTVTDDNFKQEVLEGSTPVLVDYWAEWCQPCKMLAPALEEVSESLADKLTVAKLNIDDNPETPTQYGVRGIPTLMLFDKGEMVASTVGAMSKAQLQKWIEDQL